MAKNGRKPGVSPRPSPQQMEFYSEVQKRICDFWKNREIQDWARKKYGAKYSTTLKYINKVKDDVTQAAKEDSKSHFDVIIDQYKSMIKASIRTNNMGAAAGLMRDMTSLLGLQRDPKRGLMTGEGRHNKTISGETRKVFKIGDQEIPFA